MGHRAPYRAVVALCVTAATSWRTVRHIICGTGIPDPMQMPSMHLVLDFTEQAVLESLVTGDRDKDKMKRDQFFDRLYGPQPGGGKRRGSRPEVIPAGFSNTEQAASFTGFMRSVGGAP